MLLPIYIHYVTYMYSDTPTLTAKCFPPGGCLNEGECTAPGECSCRHGWDGEQCQQRNIIIEGPRTRVANEVLEIA